VATRSTRRWFLWPGLLTPSGIFCFAALAFLLPPDALVWPGSIIGTTYRTDTATGTAALTRNAGRWEGHTFGFPPGTATHFAPDTHHGFFVVHLPDGRFLALSDRSAHRGQRVYWHDPLPSYDQRGRDPGFRDRDHGTVYAADGQNIGGPAPRPLDPYPFTINNDRLIIESFANCPPPDAPGSRMWCRAP
jgi:Rieske Fe-S protein